MPVLEKKKRNQPEESRGIDKRQTSFRRNKRVQLVYTHRRCQTHIVIKGVPQSSEHLAQQYDLASVFHPSSTDEGFEFLKAKDTCFIRGTCLETVLKK
jgi:hypothetical protein